MVKNGMKRSMAYDGLHEKVATALLVANMSMLTALGAVDNRMGFGVESAIQEMWPRLRSIQDENVEEKPNGVGQEERTEASA